MKGSSRCVKNWKTGEQKQWKREWRRKAEMRTVQKVKHLSLTHTRRHACLRKLRHEQTKQQQWLRYQHACTQKTYWDIGKAKGWKIRWIYRAKTHRSFLLHTSWHFHSDRARYSFSASSLQFTHTNMHAVRMNSWGPRGRKLFWRAKEKKQTVAGRWICPMAADK